MDLFGNIHFLNNKKKHYNNSTNISFLREKQYLQIILAIFCGLDGIVAIIFVFWVKKIHIILEIFSFWEKKMKAWFLDNFSNIQFLSKTFTGNFANIKFSSKKIVMDNSGNISFLSEKQYLLTILAIFCSLDGIMAIILGFWD